jgi:poly [ADP-ribose] polymerase
MAAFEKKFKEKSGHKFADRFDPPKPKKYVYVEKSYEPDSEVEDGSVHAGDIKKEKENAKPVADDPIPESKLPSRVQALVEFIFSSKNFDFVMAEMNYDAQKLPLGKLSKRTLLSGFETLKALADIINGSDASSPERMGELSDLYFSFIPHAFGRQRKSLSFHLLSFHNSEIPHDLDFFVRTDKKLT